MGWGLLTLTNERGETGLRCPAPASEGPFLTSGAGWRESREKTCTVPLSDDRASHCGLSPLLKAMLYMHAGSAPLRSSCRVALTELRPPICQARQKLL